MMEPIPYFYDSINRNAILIKPKKAMFEWVNKIYPESPVENENEGTIYLIKKRISVEAIKNWLKKNFDKIFQNELNNWHTDEKDWPKKRSYKQFTEWFEFEIHSMILDVEETAIIKE